MTVSALLVSRAMLPNKMAVKVKEYRFLHASCYLFMGIGK
jgi:hypothetical protein